MNLSSHSLTTMERSVLKLGLGFVMTPKYDSFQTRIDLFKLIRQLKLRTYFDSSSCIPDKRMFKPKSRFIPFIQHDDISVFERLVLRDIEGLEGKRHYYRHNLSIQQKDALNSLADDSSIVIKPADKDGAIVAMNKEDYIMEANRQ